MFQNFTQEMTGHLLLWSTLLFILISYLHTVRNIMYKTRVYPTFTQLPLYRIGERSQMEHMSKYLCPAICFGTSVLPGYSLTLPFSPSFFFSSPFPSHFYWPSVRMKSVSASVCSLPGFPISFLILSPSYCAHIGRLLRVWKTRNRLWLTLFFMKASSKHDKGVGSLALHSQCSL